MIKIFYHESYWGKIYSWFFLKKNSETNVLEFLGNLGRTDTLLLVVVSGWETDDGMEYVIAIKVNKGMHTIVLLSNFNLLYNSQYYIF